MKSKFYKLLLVVYSILSIASTVYLLMRPADSQHDVKYEETKQELQHIKEYLKIHNAQYEQAIDSLKSKSDSLQHVIAITDTRLKYSRKQVLFLSDQVNGYIDRYDQDTTLKKDNHAFDSLSNMSRSYIDVSRIRDSICDAEIKLLKDQTQIKDSIIAQSESMLTEYKSSNEKLLALSDNLNEDLLLTKKKLKRKTLHGRVLSVGMVFLSGFILAKYVIQ